MGSRSRSDYSLNCSTRRPKVQFGASSTILLLILLQVARSLDLVNGDPENFLKQKEDKFDSFNYFGSQILTMEDPAMPRRPELQVRRLVDNAHQELDMIFSQERSKQRNHYAKHQLDIIRLEYSNARKEFNIRQADLKTEEDKQLALNEWLTWSSTAMENIFNHEEKFKEWNPSTAEGSGTISAMETVQMSVSVNRFNGKLKIYKSKVVAIEAILTKLQLHLNGEADDCLLNRSKAVNYGLELDKADQLMKDLEDFKVNMQEGDPDGYAACTHDFDADTKSLYESISVCKNSYHSLKLPEIPSYLATQSSNSSLLGAASIQPSTQVTSTNSGTVVKYNYQSVPLPKFTGDYGLYKRTKGEWMNTVLPGKDDSWGVRMLQLNTPDEDDLSFCQTVEECWRLLDNKYANSNAVSNVLMTEFFATKKVDGENEYQQICAVYRMVKSLENKLPEAHKTQLTDQLHPHNHIMSLIPPRFAEQLASDFEKEGKAKNRDLTPRESFNVLISFLESKNGHIQKYFAPFLIKKGKGSTNDDQPSSSTLTKQQKKALALQKKAEKALEASGLKGKSPSVPNSGGSGQGSGLKGEDAKKAAWKRFGGCPCCKDVKGGTHNHTWKPARGPDVASNRVSNCDTFLNMDQDQKVEACTKFKICYICLCWTHEMGACTSKLKCTDKSSGQACGKLHHKLLHNNQNLPQKCLSLRSLIKEAEEADLKEGHILFPITKVKINGVCLNVFLDDGSNQSLISHECARRLNLQGRFKMEELEVAGGNVIKGEAKFYYFKWKIGTAEPRTIRLMGLDVITNNPGAVDVTAAYKIFPHAPANSLERPGGEKIDMLIGLDHNDLLPSGGKGKDMVGKLKLMSIPFGTGFVLKGRHPAIQGTPIVFSEEASKWREAKSPLSKAFFLNKMGSPCVHMANLKHSFEEMEILGYHTPPKCDSCKHCVNCNVLSQGMTIQERKELQMMKDSLQYDPIKKKITVEYPVVGDPSLYKDNRKQVEARYESLEKSLIKKGLLETYNNHIREYISRGVWRSVTLEEVEDYKKSGGTVHWVAHHMVRNGHSKSTPIRLVVDSAVKNCWNGPTINQLYGKGPNIIGDLFTIFMRWRMYEVSMITDLSKAYHKIGTSIKEFFTRLVAWRENPESPWQYFGHDVVGMGDVSAAMALQVAKNYGAQLGKDIDAYAALIIEISTYVDDFLGGGARDQVNKMVGEQTKHADGSFTYTGTLVKILELIGFSVKYIITSGEADPVLLEKLGPILGHKWDPTRDVIKMKPILNFFGKEGAFKLGPDLTPADTESLKSIHVTRRRALTALAQQYDPTGLISPYIAKLKIMMKNLVVEGYGWDEYLSKEHEDSWRELFIEMVTRKEIEFPRCVLTSTKILGDGITVLALEIIGYWDGSNQAYTAVVYMRVQTAPDTWWTTLICSKVRVTPAAGFSTPRAELSGLLILVRLIRKVQQACLENRRPRRITCVGDSTCTISSAESNASALKPFFANRIVEIIDHMDQMGQDSPVPATEEISCVLPSSPEESSESQKTYVDKLWHTAGTLNIADLPTRGTAKWEELGPDSTWQNGPEYLRKNRAEWPITRDFINNIPEVEVKKVHHPMVLAAKVQKLNLSKSFLSKIEEVMYCSDNIDKVIRILGRICRAVRSKDRSQIETDLDNDDLEQAKWWLEFITMFSTVKMLNNGKLQGLNLFWSGGLLCTQGRIPDAAMRILTGHSSLIVIPGKSRLAWLILKKCHNVDHRATPGDSLGRSRNAGYWIVAGKAIAKSIAKNCGYCKKNRALTVGQQMGQLPPEKLDVPCFPFEHCGVDYLGPYNCIDGVKRRTSRKAFIIAWKCLSTGACWLTVAEDYSTDQFLLCFSTMEGIFGKISYIYSDLGTQFSKASKVIGMNDPPEIPWKQITARLKGKVTWKLAPAGAAFRNGGAESCVKACKHALSHLSGSKGNNLTHLELQHLLNRVSNVINSRPLAVRHHGESEDPGVCLITPNMLLHGPRSADHSLPQDVTETDNSKYTIRYRFVEVMFQQWWKKWWDTIFPHLVPLKRWKFKERNMQVDDIVLVKFAQKYSKPEFRMGRVLSVEKDASGLVRTCSVGMRQRREKEPVLSYDKKKLKAQDFPVQRLVVLLAADEEIIDPDSQFPRIIEDFIPTANHLCDNSPPVKGFKAVGNVPKPSNMQSGDVTVEIEPEQNDDSQNSQ